MFGNKFSELLKMRGLNNKNIEKGGSEKPKERNNVNDKKLENLVVFLIILVITILCINSILNKDKNKVEENHYNKKLAEIRPKEDQKIGKENKEIEDNQLEEKLKNILSKIKGVEKVEVCINYSESSEIVAMYNENSKTDKTEETDDSGGIRKIETYDLQKDIVYKEENGEKVPLTRKIINPKIEGAIITAKGSENINVKADIIKATEALTGLASHKIQVFQMN